MHSMWFCAIIYTSNNVQIRKGAGQTMRENQDKKMEKWSAEIDVLTVLKESLEEFAELKDAKGEKEKIDILNAKIANLIEDNSWIRMEWSVVKRGKQSRQEGIDKLAQKIKDRQKKIAAQVKKAEEADPVPADIDAEKLQAECAEGAHYFHWAYGEVEVLAIEGDYVYVKLLDRKGVRDGWMEKNNAVVSTGDGLEEVKEFPRTAIGIWLFPDAKDVPSVEGIESHKVFKI